MSVLPTTVSSLKSKSGKAISVFQKTVSDLALVNVEAEKLAEKKSEKAARLISEANDARSVITTNEKFIAKLNEFLGLE